MRIGEAFVGDVPNNAHPNVMVGRREELGATIAQSLASPSRDHVSFMAVLRPNVMVKPDTLFVNKVATVTPEIARMTWGPAQAGVARGVHEALAEGILPPDAAENWVVVAAVWVNPLADDPQKVEANNRLAIKAALLNAFDPPAQTVRDAAAASAANPFYSGET